MRTPEAHTVRVEGILYDLMIDDCLGHICICHSGELPWEVMQAIKTAVWGRSARAIEVFPPEDAVVNEGNYRHLFLLGQGDFSPDLLGVDWRTGPVYSLEKRWKDVWAESEEIFRG